MDTATTTPLKCPAFVVLCNGFATARVLPLLMLLAALAWTAQAPAALAAPDGGAVTDEAEPWITPIALSKAGPVLPPIVRVDPLDVFICNCQGNWKSFMLSYDGGSSSVTVEVTLTGLAGGDPNRVQSFSGTNPGDVVNVVAGAGGTVGGTAQVRVGGTLVATITSTCTGSPTPLNQDFSASGHTVRVNKIVAEQVGGGGMTTCEIQGDLNCASSLPPDLNVQNLTRPGEVTNLQNGDEIKFTFPINNHGVVGGGLIFPADVPGVEVEVVYDAALWDVQSATGGDSQDTSTPGSITFRVNVLARSGTVSLMWTLKVKTGATGSATVYAGVSAAGADDPDSSPDGAKVLPVQDDECAISFDSLPVELVSFDALLDGRSTMLKWETASETNNAGFEVQHRFADGDFAPVGWVEGHGTTEQPQAYRYGIGGLEPGTHRFRLKQIDFDGAFEYSPEVEVTVEMVEAFFLRAPYPNPFNPETTIQFGVRTSQQVEVAIYDMLGRQVRTLYQGRPPAGVTQILRFDGSSLQSGTYLVRVLGETFQRTQTVTLLK